jgi:hypothetical protein
VLLHLDVDLVDVLPRRDDVEAGVELPVDLANERMIPTCPWSTTAVWLLALRRRA